MKKAVLFLFVIITYLLTPIYLSTIHAQHNPPPQIPQITIVPDPCQSGGSNPGSYCPDLSRADKPEYREKNAPDIANYRCADTYEDWLKDKSLNFWVEDPEVTALGKGGERSRQFLL